MCFFHLNYVNVWGILTQTIYNAHAIFVSFLMLKMGNDPKSEVSLVSWFPLCPSALELVVPRKANLIFQWISLFNATLLSILFFACCVHKLNYIKNAFFQSINQIYHHGFSQGDFMQFEKVELKENYFKGPGTQTHFFKIFLKFT